MAFSDAERVQIRRWVGGSFLFQNVDQRLEAAMNTVESLPDSGATEDYVRDVLLVELEATFQQLSAAKSKLAALQADEVKVDFVRAVNSIRSIGRTWSTQLSHALGLRGPLRDAWSAAEPDSSQQLGDVRGLSVVR